MNKGMTMPKMLLLLAEVLLFAILAAVTSYHFGVADGLKITVANLVAYLVPRTILHRARATSVAACVVLLLMTACLLTINYLNLVDWTDFGGYTLHQPDLEGDARKYYKWAWYYYDGSVPWEKVIFPGFPIMILGLFKAFGVNVIWPQALNLMFTLTAVVLTGMTTRRLLSRRVKATPSALLASGMLLFFLLTYNLMMDISILKEGSITMSIALAGFAMSSMGASDEERFQPWRDIVLMALACLLLGAVRTTYLYFVLIGVALMALPHLRRDWVVALAMIALAVLGLVIGSQYAAYTFDRHAKFFQSSMYLQRTYAMEGRHGFYLELIGYYFIYSPWHRIAMLPITSTIQYFIPFPWLNGEDPTLFNYVCRFNYTWYLLGGVVLFYYAVMSWRRHENMGTWPWWPVVVFLGIAYVMGGTITRYVLPIQPLFIPVAMYVLCRVFEGHHRRAFTRWMIVYVVMVALVLLTCLELQEGTVSHVLHTPSLLDLLQSLRH